MEGTDPKFARKLRIKRPREERLVILDAGVRNKSHAAKSEPDTGQYCQTLPGRFRIESPGWQRLQLGGLCHWAEPEFGAGIERKLRKGVRILYTQQIQYTVIAGRSPEMSHPSSGLRVKG